MARQMNGTVTSDKVDKTIVITVRVRRTHPLYKKQYTVNTKFMAHDETNQAKVGDLVTMSEIRPKSARKRFKLERIIERGGARFEEADAVSDVAEEVVEPVAEKPADKPKAEAKEKPASRVKKAPKSEEAHK